VLVNRSRMVRALGVAAAAALALSACGGDSGGPASASDGEGGDVTLRFTWWGSDTRHQATQEIIDAFEDANPGITINPEYGDWGGYWDKLATQVASNDAPDIIQMDEKYLREYADRGALLDLSDVETGAMTDATVATGRTEEGLFGIPTGINAMALMANPDIFEAAGVALPDDTTWTWDDYADIAKQVDDGSEFYGATGPNEPATFQIWLRQQGKEMTTEDGQLGFEVSDAQEYLDLMLDLRERGALPEASILSEDQSPGPDQSLTGTGQVAMGAWWTNQLAALSTAAGTDLVPLRFPSSDGSEGGAQLFYKSSMYMSGNARTQHPEEVKKFIDFMVNSEEAGKINLADRGLPANLEVRDVVLGELDEADTRGAEFLADIEDELGDPMAVPPLGFSTMQEAIYRYELEVWFGRQSTADAAQQLYNEMESAIG